MTRKVVNDAVAYLQGLAEPPDPELLKQPSPIGLSRESSIYLCGLLAVCTAWQMLQFHGAVGITLNTLSVAVLLGLMAIGVTATAGAVATTILTTRAPGMTMRRIPPFSWSASRHDTFASCKRRYYYSYYASFEDEEIAAYFEENEDRFKTDEMVKVKYIRIAYSNFLADPEVFAHNVETVPRLYRTARPGSKYAGSLELLAEAACWRDSRRVPMRIKSSLMLGLGETDDEVLEVMIDLKQAGELKSRLRGRGIVNPTMDTGRDVKYRSETLSSLRIITYGSEPMPAETLERVGRAFPGVEVPATMGYIDNVPGPRVVRQRVDSEIPLHQVRLDGIPFGL